jgi:hypothetical protein
MEASQLVMIMAKNWSQFSAGEGWLLDNGHLEGLRRKPIYVEHFNYERKLRGIRDAILYIMDEAGTLELEIYLHRYNFSHRNKIFAMEDTRDRPELNFKLTEIIHYGKPN